MLKCGPRYTFIYPSIHPFASYLIFHSIHPFIYACFSLSFVVFGFFPSFDSSLLRRSLPFRWNYTSRFLCVPERHISLLVFRWGRYTRPSCCIVVGYKGSSSFILYVGYLGLYAKQINSPLYPRLAWHTGQRRPPAHARRTIEPHRSLFSFPLGPSSRSRPPLPSKGNAPSRDARLLPY